MDHGSNSHYISPDKRRKPCLIVRVCMKKKKKSVQIFGSVVSVGPGTYREKVEIPATMAYITLRGAGAEKTTIDWDDTADRKGPNGKPMGTSASATLTVNSPHFIAKNITFRDSAPSPPSGALGKQAVALRISGDKGIFKSCGFTGARDTLYHHMGRHYFENSYIEGSVDFLFGDGLSLPVQELPPPRSYQQIRCTYCTEEGQLAGGDGFSGCRVTGSGASTYQSVMDR